MGTLFYNYIMTFLHPFSGHEKLREIRESMAQKDRERITIITNETIGEAPIKLSFLEAMSVSWAIRMVYAVYAIFSIHLGVVASKAMIDSESYGNIFFNNFPMKSQQMVLLTALMAAIFYPFSMWVYTKFWGVLIKFFANLFNIKGNIDEMSDEIVNHSLVSNFFLLIPIFGEVAKHFSSLVYIFAGLRKNLGMTALQASVVIFSPVFLVVVFLMILLLYVLMIVNMF
ncbi:hypothetical protein M899_1109 [Bacteriovorax sp. BSW11_IV]|nr:hypothetical protein M899_1109 [Bacteriovorax sp. BSW11_IV]